MNDADSPMPRDDLKPAAKEPRDDLEPAADERPDDLEPMSAESNKGKPQPKSKPDVSEEDDPEIDNTERPPT